MCYGHNSARDSTNERTQRRIRDTSAILSRGTEIAGLVERSEVGGFDEVD